MFPGFGALIDAVIFALGVAWCVRMAQRFRSDSNQLRTGDDALPKAAIVVMWLVTLGIVAWVFRFVYTILSQIIEGIRMLRS